MGRWMNIKDLMEYTTLGRNYAREVGEKAGAVVRFGRRIVYDRDKIDEYLGAKHEES